MNTVGGGGSILTLPAMIFLGIPAGVANATNRIGVVAQNMVSVVRFRATGIQEDRLSWRLIVPSLAGTLLGAYLAARIPDRQFELLLAVIMVLLVFPIAFRPKPLAISEGTTEELWARLSLRRRIITRATFFAIGVYMGFLMAGTGIIILAALSTLLRLDLVRGNYVKVLFIWILNFIALGYFIVSGVEIAWIAGLTLAAGQFIGGWVGVWVTIRIGDLWIQRSVIVSILISATALFYRYFTT